MRRRDFVILLRGAAATWSLAGHAQPPNQVRRIGALIGGAQTPADPRTPAFVKGLQQLGWSEGRNLRIDWRYGAGDPARIRAYAAELVGLNPDVIFAVATPAVPPLLQATRTIPIVFAFVADPVSNGFVTSLSRPDRNITGFVSTEDSISTKWLGLLKEIDPRISRVLVLRDPTAVSTENRWLAIKAAEAAFKLELVEANARDSAEIERAIASFTREPNGGVIVLPGIFRGTQAAAVAAVMARHRVPAIYASRSYVDNGGLVSYGADQVDLWGRAATYVDRVLRGAKPEDLPIQLPTKFELVINLKSATALGLTVPLTLRTAADEVIE
jgi:putative tryptophan/tyrosine transport system substrate-binding protein